MGEWAVVTRVHTAAFDLKDLTQQKPQALPMVSAIELIASSAAR